MTGIRTMTHLINRLQLNINFSEQEDAFNMRQNFAQTYQVQIAEVVDRVCSKYAGEHEWLKIDKLEMDLGYFRPNGLRHSFADVFLFHFEKALTAKLSEVTHEQRETSQQMSQIELLEYFLQHGTVPWFANEDEIDLDGLTKEMATRNAPVLYELLLRNKWSPNVWKRVSYQMSGEVKSVIFELFEELRNAEDKARSLAEEFLSNIGKTGAANENGIFKKTKRIIIEEAAEIFKHPADANMMRKIIEKHVSQIFLEDSREAGVFFRTGKISKTENTDQDAGQAEVESKKAATVEQLLAKSMKNTEQGEERFVVKHAGVLLLSPFFNSFFTRLKLLKGSEWINKAAQYKGIHLLKFLSTGHQKFAEFTLILEKIFCGMAVEEPVPAEVELLETDLSEATDLLESAILHWKVLKNTSVNGLREAFLKRDGIVTPNENGWLIQVERKTHDVLLDSIPWGYSTISLPWNDYIVAVEW